VGGSECWVKFYSRTSRDLLTICFLEGDIKRKGFVLGNQSFEVFVVVFEVLVVEKCLIGPNPPQF
jgi:hypothetical protein